MLIILEICVVVVRPDLPYFQVAPHLEQEVAEQLGK